MLRVLLTLALLGFTVYAVVDCIQTEDERVRNLPKLAWVALVLLFTPAGGIAWFIAGRPTDAGGFPRIGPGVGPFGGGPQDRPRGPGGWGGRGGGSGPTGPRGPDDDPDFLKKL
ncbi:MAG: PLDc_N domain-containing protein [Austwickia sp.]|nr:MAG: PLDc_N domain-containing protein [Austwickia sp.]